MTLPNVHILMPVYNTERFITDSIKSVLNQEYDGKLTLLILNDGSDDNSLQRVLELIESNPPLFKDKIIIQTVPHQGVAMTRDALIKWSRRIDPDAYVFWLDSDDQYVTTHVLTATVTQMVKTEADICLLPFSITYEDESQKGNVAGLLREKATVDEMIAWILKESPGHTTAWWEQDIAGHSLLNFTSLGWTKVYAPRFLDSICDMPPYFPQPHPSPFEDFVYMALLLEAKYITAYPGATLPIQYTRRSTSICGNRLPANFTEHIPAQLKKFVDVVSERILEDRYREPQLKMAQEFVNRKLSQYENTLRDLINSHREGFTEEIMITYLRKATDLKEYINTQLPAPAISPRSRRLPTTG